MGFVIAADCILIDGDTALVVIPSDVAGWRHVDRPCDNCDGHGHPEWCAPKSCPSCDGTGRHTFKIETVNMGTPYQPAEPHYRTLRVHVIDVLPIDFDRWYETDWYRTLPPAAEPGMWLIRLAVHQ